MTRRIEDLLHHKHGFPADAVARLDDEDIRSLVGMIRGGDAQTNRVRALDLLVASGARPAQEVVAELLQRDAQDPMLCAAALAKITRLPAPWAESMLLDLLKKAGPPAATPCNEADTGRPSPLGPARMAAALGRCGSRAAIPALQALVDAPGLDPMVSAQARFALTLIACREGLPSFEPAPPAAPALQADDENDRPVRVLPATAKAADEAVHALAGQLFGIRPDRLHAIDLACGAQQLLLLPNQAPDGIRLTKLALGRPWLAGLVTVQSQEDHGHSVWRIVLTHPQDSDRARLTVHRTDGTITMEGQVLPDGDGARFSLHTLRRPGATAASVEGRVHGDALQIVRARSGVRRLESGTPRAWMPPRG